MDDTSATPPVAGLGSRRVAAHVLFWVALLTSGCQTSLKEWVHNGFKLGPNYAPAAAPVADDWLDSDDTRVHRLVVEESYWWAQLNDPHLNGLIETASQQNLDLRTACTRILDAEAQRNIAAGNLFPQQQSLLAAYAHGQLPKNLLGMPFPHTFDLWPVGFNASWELDFWGRYRRSVEAAEGEYEATIEDYHDAALALISRVATDYILLRTFEQRIEYARNNVKIQRGALDLAESRYKEGLTSELDVTQAKTNLAQTEASIPLLVTGRRQASNRLCVLLGMPVTDLADQLRPGPIPTAPVEVAVGIPADLLRRRPDVRRAERHVAAQSALIGVAEADLYPRLALTGFLGYAANDLDSLFTPKSFLAFIIPTVQWNILNYGRIKNNIRAQEAKLEGAALQYQQTVMNAGREVEDALVAFVQAQRQAEKLAEGVKQAQRSVELVLIQYEGGTAEFNRVYNAQAALVMQQDELAQVQGNIALSLVNAYKALGGGWECLGQGTISVPEYAEENLPLPAPDIDLVPSADIPE